MCATAILAQSLVLGVPALAIRPAVLPRASDPPSARPCCGGEALPTRRGVSSPSTGRASCWLSCPSL
eukprot:7433837-Alexandrium_andersonii.AAC.1